MIMKNGVLLLMLLGFSGFVSAQKNTEVSVAFINIETAYPFAQVGNIITRIQHPGVEIGYGFNWKTKTKHDWYQEIKLAYFYHKFVQHAFPLYTDVGYRYKFSPKWTAQIAIGAGYLHSIPTTAKLKLGENGEYKNDKGIGRAQTMATIKFGAGYTVYPTGKRPLKIQAIYQPLLQTPFVKAYVPILPYNSLLIGCVVPVLSHKKIRS